MKKVAIAAYVFFVLVSNAYTAPPGFDPHLLGYIDSVCAKNKIPPVVVYAIIEVESKWNTRAVGRGTDFGLMQLNVNYIPEFIDKYGNAGYKYSPKSDPYDNVVIGIRHLRRLLDLFHGDYFKAIIAYNCGYSRVIESRIPLSSIDYLEKVMMNIPFTEKGIRNTSSWGKFY